MPSKVHNQVNVGFAPIAADNARTLILGSLPGQRSLRAREYYAHPQNAFWDVMASLFGINGNYKQRCEQLTRQGVALWDVLQESDRPGSMDADIRLAGAIPNDFGSFLELYSHIERICFNGRKAEQLFQRLVVPTLEAKPPELIGLPSTSPAYASMSFGQKLAIWRRDILNQA